MTQTSAPDLRQPTSVGPQAVGAWLARHCQVLPSTSGGAVVIRGSQGPRVVAAHPPGQRMPDWIDGVVSRAFEARGPIVSRREGDDGSMQEAIAHPLFRQHELVGAAVLLRAANEDTPDEEPETGLTSTPRTRQAESAPQGGQGNSGAAQRFLETLKESIAQFPSLDAPSHGNSQVDPALPGGLNSIEGRRQGHPGAAVTRNAHAPQVAPNAAPAVVQVLRKLMVARNAAEGDKVLAVALTALLECDRVSIGVRRKATTQLTACSDGWNSETSAVSADVAAAMDESIDQGATIVFPAPANSRLQIRACHALLSERRRSRSLCTVPMSWRGDLYGAVVAEREHAKPFAPEDVRLLQEVLAVAAPWLAAQKRLEWPVSRLLRSATGAWFAKLGKGRYKLACAAATAGMAALLAWPVEREISAPVKLEGAIQRAIASPGDSYLQKVLVRPGDKVTTGQLLMEFASEDLQVERQRLNAELGSHDAAAADAMSKQDLGNFAVHSAKMKETGAQLALLDHRMERLRITSPMDGVVIQGDLSQSLGAPIKKGDLLMVLAPSNDYRAVMEVAEEDIAQVHAGQAGAMVLSALPHTTLAMRVKQITPLVTAAQGRSYFEVELEFGPHRQMTNDLRPGMQGIARLKGAKAARGSVWFEDALAWCRLVWWRWIG